MIARILLALGANFNVFSNRAAADFTIWRTAHACSTRAIHFSKVFAETARIPGKSPSSRAHIERSRQNLLHEEFVEAEAPVEGCGCVERTSHSISRNKQPDEANPS